MKKLLVVIGCSSAIAAPLVKEIQRNTQTQVLLLGRQPNIHIQGEFMEYDARDGHPPKLFRILDEYTHIEIFWLVGIKSGNIDEVIEVNFLAPVKVYEKLINRFKEKMIKFIVFSSQGDVHGGLSHPGYNASKSALSNYFMPQIFKNDPNFRVFIVKPWIFHSQMMKKKYFNCDKTKLAKYVVRNINHNHSVIVYPKWTYLIVRTLNYIFPRKIYKLLSFFDK